MERDPGIKGENNGASRLRQALKTRLSLTPKRSDDMPSLQRSKKRIAGRRANQADSQRIYFTKIMRSGKAKKETEEAQEKDRKLKRLKRERGQTMIRGTVGAEESRLRLLPGSKEARNLCGRGKAALGGIPKRDVTRNALAGQTEPPKRAGPRDKR